MIRKAMLQGRDYGSCWVNAPASERRFRQDARPSVEELHDFGTRLDLRREKLDGALDENTDQRLETLNVVIGPTLDLSEVSARPAFHHIGRDRPWRTGKPYQGGFRAERLEDAANGLEHWFEAQNNLPGIEPSNVTAVLDRLE